MGEARIAGPPIQYGRIARRLDSQRRRYEGYDPRTLLGETLGATDDWSKLSPGELIGRTVLAVQALRTPKDLPYGEKSVIYRQGYAHDGLRLIDPVEFFRGNDESSSIRTSFGGHPDARTYLSTDQQGRVVLRQENVDSFGKSAIAVLPQEGNHYFGSYEEQMDVMAIDLHLVLKGMRLEEL